VALSIAAGRQRIDRHHLIASGDQRPDQQPRSVSIPTTTSAGSSAQEADELVQPGHPGHPIGDPLAGQHAPIGRHHAHIMVTLGPIDPNQQHRQLLLSRRPLLAWRRAAAP
jgi:hypothetical protein